MVDLRVQQYAPDNILMTRGLKDTLQIWSHSSYALIRQDRVQI